MIRAAHENARALGISLHTTGYRKNWKKSFDELRAQSLEWLYGAGLGVVRAESGPALDKRIATGILARQGKLGRNLQEAQAALRDAQNAIAEYRRITGLTRRRPRDEADLLRTAREKLAIAKAAQDKHLAARAAH